MFQPTSRSRPSSWSRRPTAPTRPRSGRGSGRSNLARIAELRDRGVVVEAGGYTDLSTALVLIRADSAEAALAIARDDIYLSSGVWVELRVKPFGRVIRPAELPTATAS
jgi:uncharacterized protein YciI